jgi:hypothetical protein
MSVEQARKVIAEGPIMWLRAVHIFHLLHARTPSLSSSSLATATGAEHSLRTQLKANHFDFAELYKKPKDIFQRGRGDQITTWHLTFKQALDWLPRSSRVEITEAKKYTQENPLIVMWIGARDDNEGLADFNALSKVLSCPSILYLIGPAPSGGAAGLSAAAEKKFGTLRVRRHIGLFTAETAMALPKPHYVAMFNAGLDRLFASWVLAIDPLLRQESPPIVFISGYAMDQSYFSSEQILHALGANVIYTPRRSPYGFTLMFPHTSNHHVLAFQGMRDLTAIAEEGEARKKQLQQVHESLRARGFDVE